MGSFCNFLIRCEKSASLWYFPYFNTVSLNTFLMVKYVTGREFDNLTDKKCWLSPSGGSVILNKRSNIRFSYQKYEFSLTLKSTLSSINWSGDKNRYQGAVHLWHNLNLPIRCICYLERKPHNWCHICGLGTLQHNFCPECPKHELKADDHILQ